MVFGAMIPYNRKTFQPGLSCNVIQQKMTRHPSRKEIAIVSDIFKIYVSFVTDVLTSPESYAFRWSRDWRIWSRRCHPYPQRMIEHRHLGRRTYRRGPKPNRRSWHPKWSTPCHRERSTLVIWLFLMIWCKISRTARLKYGVTVLAIATFSKLKCWEITFKGNGFFSKREMLFLTPLFKYEYVVLKSF